MHILWCRMNSKILFYFKFNFDTIMSLNLWANWTGWMYAIFSACKRIPQWLDRKEESIQKFTTIWMFRRVRYQIWIICTYIPDNECVSLFWRFFLNNFLKITTEILYANKYGFLVVEKWMIRIKKCNDYHGWDRFWFLFFNKLSKYVWTNIFFKKMFFLTGKNSMLIIFHSWDGN